MLVGLLNTQPLTTQCRQVEFLLAHAKYFSARVCARVVCVCVIIDILCNACRHSGRFVDAEAAM